MCNPAAGAIMGGAQLGMGIANAEAQRLQANNEADYYNYLAKKSEEQSKEIDNNLLDNFKSIKTQEIKDINSVRSQYEKAGASQKAAMAANGILSDSGTNQNIVDDTLHKLKLDEEAIKYNSSTAMIEQSRSAMNQKIGINADITSNKLKASNTLAASKINRFNTIAGSAMQAAQTGMSAAKFA